MATVEKTALKVQKATLGDVPQVHRLIQHFAATGDLLPRSLGEIYENLRDFFAVKENGQVLGCVALHVNWSDLAELKCLAVWEESQSLGIGGKLINAVLDEARVLYLPKVFALTLKPDYFARFGFRRISVKELPTKVWGECARCPKLLHCDEVAVLRDT